MNKPTKPASAYLKIVVLLFCTLLLQACASDALLSKSNKVTMYIDITDAKTSTNCDLRIALIRPKYAGDGKCKKNSPCTGNSDCYCFTGNTNITWQAKYRGRQSPKPDTDFTITFVEPLPQQGSASCEGKPINTNQNYDSDHNQLRCNFTAATVGQQPEEYTYDVELQACPGVPYDPKIIVSPN